MDSLVAPLLLLPMLKLLCELLIPTPLGELAEAPDDIELEFDLLCLRRWANLAPSTARSLKLLLHRVVVEVSVLFGAGSSSLSRSRSQGCL